MTNEKEFLFWESTSRDTIDFKMVYVDIANGDLVSGLLLSQIIYWFLPSKSSLSKLTETNGVKQLIKKRGDWFNEIRITEKQYDRAVAILEKLGLIKVELKKSNYYDGAPVPHIQLNFGVLIDLLNNQRGKSILTKGENPSYPNGEIDIPETSKTIDTETTPETISEIIKKEREEDFLSSSSENQNPPTIEKVSYLNLKDIFAQRLNNRGITYVPNRNEYSAINRFQELKVEPEAVLDLIDKLVEVKRNYPRDQFYQGICFNLSDLFSYHAKIINAHSLIPGLSKNETIDKADKYKPDVAAKHGFRAARK